MINYICNTGFSSTHVGTLLHVSKALNFNRNLRTFVNLYHSRTKRVVEFIHHLTNANTQFILCPLRPNSMNFRCIGHKTYHREYYAENEMMYLSLILCCVV